MLLAPVAAALLVRIFNTQHDCGHNAMFSSRRANDWTGRILITLTMTPYDMWRTATPSIMRLWPSGRRGVGDITTLTVRDTVRAAWGRFGYRITAILCVMFGSAPLTSSSFSTVFRSAP